MRLRTDAVVKLKKRTRFRYPHLAATMADRKALSRMEKVSHNKNSWNNASSRKPLSQTAKASIRSLFRIKTLPRSHLLLKSAEATDKIALPNVRTVNANHLSEA